VTFATTALDNCGAVTLSCVDGTGEAVASGATFPIGSRTVTCHASDPSGNVATKSFSVAVSRAAAAPVIECNAPATVSGAATFTATASEACAGPVSVEVTEYRCWTIDRHGRRAEQASCSVRASGAELSIRDAGCATGEIEWTVRATDQGGNEASRRCSVQVEEHTEQEPKPRHVRHQP
jgi:hypothetical protein